MGIFAVPLFVLSLFAPLTQAPATANINLLVDPGFEKDITESIEILYDRSIPTGFWGVTEDVGVVQGNARTGENAMEIPYLHNGSGFTQVVPLAYQPCTIAVFKFYAKNTRNINFVLRLLDEQRNQIYLAGYIYDNNSGDWFSKMIVQNIYTNTAFIQIVVSSPLAQKGSGMFDDFSLKVYDLCSAE